jgi:hypothetical protein
MRSVHPASSAARSVSAITLRSAIFASTSASLTAARDPSSGRDRLPGRRRPVSSNSATSASENPSRWAALITRSTVTVSAG